MSIKKFRNCFLLDESLNNNLVSGNKFRKLQGILSKTGKISGILSFGSPYSSHLLACAWWTKRMGIPFIGIVISDKEIVINDYPHLKMAKIFGASLSFTSNKEAYTDIENAKQKFSEYLWIPGGAHTIDAAKAYESYFDELFMQEDCLNEIESIILPYGTGTTAYGVWKSVQNNNRSICIYGISVSRSKEKCYQAIHELEGKDQFDGLVISDQFAGQYGTLDKNTNKLRWDFFNETGILPDPVYNAKSVHYFYQSSLRNVLILNTGGMLNNLL